MAKGRRFSRMMSVSDGYWYCVHQRRFYRFVYAAMAYFSVFALVVSFFQVGAGTRFSPTFAKESQALTNAEIDDNQRMLMWLYAFYPTPLALAWGLVYFGKFFFCYRIKRLRRAHHYKYNLLLSSIAAACAYGLFLKLVLKMDVTNGPKLRVAIMITLSEVALMLIELHEEYKIRKARHARKRLLRQQQQQQLQQHASHLQEHSARLPAYPHPAPHYPDPQTRTFAAM
ncbi:TPA: hypothetical protein N0F65_007932 [Lagenidium giganteum]|uniref:Uncharacterized protein n=1 Tax=Lagenidium giganteum TaxID=4803 RepID=A0AAV2YJT3_9STRA|nr:TPA: hypothetical protein N0F65_007932 [Lagenidium giganteum]